MTQLLSTTQSNPPGTDPLAFSCQCKGNKCSVFLRQRKSSHISRYSCSQWKLAHTGNVSSRGKRRIYGVGSFQRGSHSPKGHLLADLAMTLSIFVSPLFSHQGCVCRNSPCEHYRATTTELCSKGAVFAS